MLARSFRLPARAVLPLALVFILSACGGGTTTEPVSTRVVRGPGFTFAVPGGLVGWSSPIDGTDGVLSCGFSW